MISSKYSNFAAVKRKKNVSSYLNQNCHSDDTNRIAIAFLLFFPMLNQINIKVVFTF